jgi:hypothetical protein
MQPIPMPSIIEADRPNLTAAESLVADDPGQRLNLVYGALRESCDYAQLLWHDLDGVRQYLLDSLPPDPRAPGANRVGASPTGPDDEDGWTRWMAVYAEATSALVGPQGDSGFGAGEARRVAEVRRSAPVAKLNAGHPGLVGHPNASEERPKARKTSLLHAVAFGAGAGLALRLTRALKPGRGRG